MTEAPGTVGADRPAARLRALTHADLPRVAELERELFGSSAWSPAMLAEELAADGRHYVAAEMPSAGGPGPAPLVGYAGLWFDGEDGQVMTIGVSARHQGQGIGRLLMAELVGQARTLGARSVLLEVRVDNVPAIALYERFGFTRMGRRRGYYQPENVDAWTMRLDLATGSSRPQPAGSTEAPA
jgi:ribosomal-protein-alanine N-acetyltransferase